MRLGRLLDYAKRDAQLPAYRTSKSVSKNPAPGMIRIEWKIGRAMDVTCKNMNIAELGDDSEFLLVKNVKRV